MNHLGRSGSGDALQKRTIVELGAVLDGVDSVVVDVSRADGTFGDLEGLRLLVQDGAGVALVACAVRTATTETALVLGEVYRHAGWWKIRSVVQAWDSGLAGLARDHGVSVDDAGADGEAVAALAASGVPAQDPADDATPLATVAGDAGRVRVTGARLVRRGVSTRRPAPAPAVVPEPRLADEGWQSARVFSVSGVGAVAEQEKRATSALLTTMTAVRSFARALNRPAGRARQRPGGLPEGPVRPGSKPRLPRRGSQGRPCRHGVDGSAESQDRRRPARAGPGGELPQPRPRSGLRGRADHLQRDPPGPRGATPSPSTGASCAAGWPCTTCSGPRWSPRPGHPGAPRRRRPAAGVAAARSGALPAALALGGGGTGRREAGLGPGPRGRHRGVAARGGPSRTWRRPVLGAPGAGAGAAPERRSGRGDGAGAAAPAGGRRRRPGRGCPGPPGRRRAAEGHPASPRRRGLPGRGGRSAHRSGPHQHQDQGS